MLAKFDADGEYLISIHALREEGDSGAWDAGYSFGISIHALREEGDQHGRNRGFPVVDFYPRPPRGGRHLCRVHVLQLDIHFYPRPPRGGRPGYVLSAESGLLFLSTPSARRATTGSLITWSLMSISIHALREEGDPASIPTSRTQGISIHALREEGDCRLVRIAVDIRDFYPRPPRGGRRNRTRWRSRAM